MALSDVQINTGAFIPTTNVWDMAELSDLDVNSEAFKELLIRLYRNLNLMSLNTNIKDVGLYPQSEFICGQLWFPNPALDSSTPQAPEQRQVFRKVINFGALPDNTDVSVPHEIEITSAFTFTRIYGTASDTTALEYIHIPHTSPPGRVELSVNATDVIIDSTTDFSNFDTTYVILEYIKN